MKPPGYEHAETSDIPSGVREQINKRQWPLFMSGSVGTGKTCAAACLYGSFHRLPMWQRADDFLLSIALGRTGGVQVESFNEYGGLSRKTVPFHLFVDRLNSASCLFLDDIGIRKPTDPMKQALFDILEWRSKKPICITSNHSLGTIAEMYDERVADRISTGTVITFSGKSRRVRGDVLKV